MTRTKIEKFWLDIPFPKYILGGPKQKEKLKYILGGPKQKEKLK